eukprot:CAMPEP_0172768240 /NCGR_PEP_ID=MMETSP1074-20121228/184383_1 /TAXON_ID=2916 /ORGANISM="Ceratium fusus, Strain PA161109" /LENGTH=112 /DNA_ID=CAMNT_0013603613 /DNA_START=69 /DNA_END=405 /DNA_ORIENTATION=-
MWWVREPTPGWQRLHTANNNTSGHDETNTGHFQGRFFWAKAEFDAEFHAEFHAEFYAEFNAEYNAKYNAEFNAEFNADSTTSAASSTAGKDCPNAGAVPFGNKTGDRDQGDL